jgi:hypothetical protein
MLIEAFTTVLLELHGTQEHYSQKPIHGALCAFPSGGSLRQEGFFEGRRGQEREP